MTKEEKAKTPHGEGVDLNYMKGAMVETIIESYSCTSEQISKKLIATIVFSARDLQPHVILSVTCNGQTMHFGTNTKKAIEFYNQQ